MRTFASCRGPFVKAMLLRSRPLIEAPGFERRNEMERMVRENSERNAREFREKSGGFTEPQVSSFAHRNPAGEAIHATASRHRGHAPESRNPASCMPGQFLYLLPAPSIRREHGQCHRFRTLAIRGRSIRNIGWPGHQIELIQPHKSILDPQTPS